MLSRFSIWLVESDHLCQTANALENMNSPIKTFPYFRFFLLLLGTSLGSGQVMINEFAASNRTLEVVSGSDATPDWIEIFNGGTSAVDLSGWFLSDDLENAEKWKIPSGTVIDSKSYLVFSLGDDGDRAVFSLRALAGSCQA